MKKLIVALVTCSVVAGMSLSAMPTFAQGDQASSSSSSSMSKKHHHKKKTKSESSSSSSSG
ncbi:MAG TPA: hypothetical protein VMU40_09910 [Steroidobacteraceae bacterium]|nr:hypothetical protein [Steroidobacteraceae bacterium]